jgi:hypothetical protein
MENFIERSFHIFFLSFIILWFFTLLKTIIPMYNYSCPENYNLKDIMFVHLCEDKEHLIRDSLENYKFAKEPNSIRNYTNMIDSANLLQLGLLLTTLYAFFIILCFIIKIIISKYRENRSSLHERLLSPV